MADYEKDRERRREEEAEFRDKERFDRENREKERERMQREMMPMAPAGYPPSAERELEKQRMFQLKQQQEDFERANNKYIINANKSATATDDRDEREW